MLTLLGLFPLTLHFWLIPDTQVWNNVATSVTIGYNRHSHSCTSVTSHGLLREEVGILIGSGRSSYSLITSRHLGLYRTVAEYPATGSFMNIERWYQSRSHRKRRVSNQRCL